jgi:hypothetical protein
VSVGCFKIAIRMLGCIAVCRGVWPRRVGEREGSGCHFIGSGPEQGDILYVGKTKGVAGRVRYGLWGAGERGGADMWVWMCRSRLDMFGLRYVRAK